MKKRSAALFMLTLALACLTAHFVFGWQAFQHEQQEHSATASMSSFLVTWGRDVFENLQSEFLQLFFQFLLLAGAFRFIKVEVYEKDQEEIRQRLDQIGKSLERRDAPSPVTRTNGYERGRTQPSPAPDRLIKSL